jgi:predicted nucleic acid-binding protein
LGKLERDLEAHTVIGVDTAPFIYLWERHPVYSGLSETLFQYLDSPKVYGVTSIITMIEACVYPQRQGRMDLVRTYERALLYSRQIRTLPIDEIIARRAITLRADYGIHVPDALQIAAANACEATLFVTNDRRLCKVREISVMVLDDYVLHQRELSP